MKSAGDVTVTVTAVDHVSPVLRRIGHRLWWMQYGGFVTSGLVAAVLILSSLLAFILGRITA